MSSVFSEDRWHFHPFAVMIIAADRPGKLPRLVRTPRKPLLDVHATNSTNFHLSRLFDLPRISTGTIRHAPQHNAINHHKSAESHTWPGVVKRDNIGICTRSTHRPPITVEIGVDLKPGLPVCLAGKTHWQDRFQVYTKERIVFARALILCSRLVIIKPTFRRATEYPKWSATTISNLI